MEPAIAATISNDPPASPASDFDFLRQQGIKYIQQLAGTTWTDHNLHDPGITILDQLCYTITELSYRIDYDIETLLADENGDPYKHLFSPAQILTVNPVTITDIRKVIIDVEGVKNAWVEKVMQPEPRLYFNTEAKTLHLSDQEDAGEPIFIKGLYRISIEQDERSASLKLLPKDLAAAVSARLNGCRNLGEDFDSIAVLDIQGITISGYIEVGMVTDINSFAAHLLFRIANFISPHVTFYTMAEMMRKGKTIDELFDGPALSHGFLDDDELKGYDRKAELHVSDVIREMMDVPGVVGVNGVSAAAATTESWLLDLDDTKAPRLDDTGTLNSLVFMKNGTVVKVDKHAVSLLLAEMHKAVYYPPLNPKDRDVIIPEGTAMNIGVYHSLQHHFPAMFGIGDNGLPASAPPLRVAQARQLKAYLLLFEQVLANYFMQAAHLKNLFSVDGGCLSTYFYLSLRHVVPGAEQLIRVETYEHNIALATESSEDAATRKNRFLDHLLARFNEDFTAYALLSDEKNGRRSFADLANDKMNFLRSYPSISNERFKASNYSLNSWDTANVSGLEKRIAAKIGIRNFTRRSLAGKTEEGFHMIEHILMRPRPEDLPEAFFSLPQAIESFRQLDGGYVSCRCVNHGLLPGERVNIEDAGPCNGTFTVERVTPDSFQVKVGAATPNNTAGNAGGQAPTWTQVPPDFSLPRFIESFELRDSNGYVKCRSVNHGLLPGERINIDHAGGYTGTYHVYRVMTDSFQVIVNPAASPPRGGIPGETVATWTRASADNKIMILSQPVVQFEAADHFTRCIAPHHGLTTGEQVEITGTESYAGIYTVTDTDPGAQQWFVISKAFTSPETGGRWAGVNQLKDPYSLQLTFVFPAWIDRLSGRHMKDFIENTIREETPAHLAVYIRWLEEAEMADVEAAYKDLLHQLSIH